MSSVAQPVERGRLSALVVVLGAICALSTAVLADVAPGAVAPAVVLVVLLALAHRTVLRWQSLIGILLLVVLFIPMRRYSLPGQLPFELDPYRLLVLVVLAGWTASLLVDPRVRLRRSGFEGPIALILVTTIASILANGDRATAVGAELAKDLTFFLSYLIVFFLIVSVTTKSQLAFFARLLVGGASLVSLSAIIESRTHFNVFDHLAIAVPFLQEQEILNTATDSRGFRAFGSAQHPIALSAALVLLLPLSIYVVQLTGRRRWWIPPALLLTGTLATVSRTSVIMLLVCGVAFVVLRPREMRRFWPALVPALVIIHFALPGTIGTLKQSFFPTGGLVAQQKANAGYSGQGRLADVGPALSEWTQDPLFGRGYGTRVIGAAGPDGQILDDQWLGTLLETGVPGAFAWLWLIVSCIRRFGRASRHDRSSPEGWLLTGLAASACGFGAGMFFYDTFAFVQVTLLFFVLVGFGSVLAAPTRRATPPQLAEPA